MNLEEQLLLGCTNLTEINERGNKAPLFGRLGDCTARSYLSSNYILQRRLLVGSRGGKKGIRLAQSIKLNLVELLLPATTQIEHSPKFTHSLEEIILEPIMSLIKANAV